MMATACMFNDANPCSVPELAGNRRAQRSLFYGRLYRRAASGLVPIQTLWRRAGQSSLSFLGLVSVQFPAARRYTPDVNASAIFSAKSRAFSLWRHAFSSYVSHECWSSSSVLYRDTPCYIRQRNLCHPELVDQQMHMAARGVASSTCVERQQRNKECLQLIVNCRDELMASVRMLQCRHKY